MLFQPYANEPGFYVDLRRQYSLRCWREITQRAMRPERVMLLPPHFVDKLGLFEYIENLPVENLISEFPIKGLLVPILPRAARLYEQGFDSDPPKPVLEHLSSKLRVPMLDKEIRETVKHIIEFNLPFCYNRKRLPAVFINNCHNLDCPSILCSIRYKIIGPDLVSMCGPKRRMQQPSLSHNRPYLGCF
jgi:hypothetical protein